MTEKFVIALIEKFDGASIAELVLDNGDNHLTLRKEAAFRGQGGPLSGAGGPAASGLAAQGAPLEAHFTGKPSQKDGKPFYGATFEDKTAKLRLVYEAGPEFRNWVIWNENGKNGFFCVEPQTWTINAPNLSLPPEQTGFLAIAAGGSWTGNTRVYLEKL
jgi:galactose mutarotase-like enzyme